MAFVLVSFRGEEVTRRELTGALVIGRAPECDIAIRDILLSRRHCRLVPAEPTGWAVEDLGSKNGTHIAGEMVQWSLLNDGASIRIGKTQVKFHAGSLRAAPVRKAAPTKRRPADPFEALSGTVADFEYVAEHPPRDLSRLPTPRPQPADPASYSDEDVYAMLTEIASSSWDSIYETASGPAAVMVAGQKQRPLPTAGAKVADSGMPPRRRNLVPDASLQVIHTEPTAPPTPDFPSHPGSDVLADALPRRRGFNPVRSMLHGMKRLLTGAFRRRGNSNL